MSFGRFALNLFREAGKKCRKWVKSGKPLSSTRFHFSNGWGQGAHGTKARRPPWLRADDLSLPRALGGTVPS